MFRKGGQESRAGRVGRACLASVTGGDDGEVLSLAAKLLHTTHQLLKQKLNATGDHIQAPWVTSNSNNYTNYTYRVRHSKHLPVQEHR